MKKLYRIRKGKFISGVCDGLAKYFNIAPKLVRTIFVIIFFVFSSSLIDHIIFMTAIPKESRLS